MSWGGSESGTQLSWDSYLLTPAGHSGVTFLVASGDSGVTEFPSSSPNAVGVGGTTLTLTASNTLLNETAWTGSGGGISKYEAPPPYQNGFAPLGSTGRTTPDVAYDADPNSGVSVYDSYNGGTSKPWFKVGGTSAGAPQWAALIALADQGRALNGQPALDGGTQTLPMLYHLPPIAFNDITSGHNQHYNAGPGYDLVTGRGSPVANLVVAALEQPVITTADGTTYTLDSNGVLWHYNAAGWTALDGGVVSINIFPGGSTVYVLENGGNLRLFNGSTWGQVDTGVASFGLAGTSVLYDLRTDGTLWGVDFSQGTWTFLDSSVVSFGVAANAQVYLVDTASNLWQYTAAFGLVELTAGVASFSLPLSTTTVLVRQINGDLLQYDWTQGSWTVLDNLRRSIDFVIGADNQVYVGAISNGQWQPYALVAPGQVKALSAGQDALGFPELFVMGLDNQIWAVKLNANGVAQSGYFLTTSGVVKALSAARDAFGHPLVFVIGLNDQVYAEHFDLLGNAIGAYSFVVTGQIKSFSAGRDAFGRPLIFAVGLNDQVYADHLDALGNATAGYTFVTSGSVKAVTLGRDDQGYPELYVIGLNDQVYQDPLDALGNSIGVYTFLITGSVKTISRGPGDQLLVIGLDDQGYADQLGGTGQALGGYGLTVAGPIKALSGAS
jgi:hypothetical protein